MKLSNEKIMRRAERFQRRTDAYQNFAGEEENYQLDIVLLKGSRANPERIIAYAAYETNVIGFKPYDKSNKTEYPYFDSPTFDCDTNIFGALEEGYEIVGASSDCHEAIWNCVEEWHDGKIEHLEGLQQYLGYCKKKGVTKDSISYSGMNIMSLYDGKTQPKTNDVKPPSDINR